MGTVMESPKPARQFIFIDESGDLGMTGSKYFVLSALIVNDFAFLQRAIKNMRRYKFQKELRKAQEIKATRSSAQIIKYMLFKLNEDQKAKVFYIVLEKKKIVSEYLRNNKDKLYNYVAGKLAKNLNLPDSIIEIRIDRSKGNQLPQYDFNNYFLMKLKPNDTQPKIFHSYSHAWPGLQFADILAWAAFQKFEHRNSEYLDILKIEQEAYHIW